VHPRVRFGRRRAPGPSGPSAPACHGAAPGAARVLSAGSYVTDGRSLFRVQHGSLHGPGGELFLELEDCRTLELVLCPANALNEAEIRWVVPIEPADSRAALADGLALDG